MMALQELNTLHNSTKQTAVTENPSSEDRGHDFRKSPLDPVMLLKMIYIDSSAAYESYQIHRSQRGRKPAVK